MTTLFLKVKLLNPNPSTHILELFTKNNNKVDMFIYIEREHTFPLFSLVDKRHWAIIMHKNLSTGQSFSTP